MNKRDADMIAHNRARAKQAIAEQLCSTDMTDGFCGPRDLKCVGQGGERPSHRNCVVRAEGCLRAIETVGCSIIWDYDKRLPVVVEKKS